MYTAISPPYPLIPGRRLSSPHLPHIHIAPAMDPDFLALKRKIASTDYSFTETWFGPDDIVESLDWDEAIGDGFRRYSYNSKTDILVVVVPTSLHLAIEAWLRNEVERLHNIGFITSSELQSLRLLFGNIFDNFPRPFLQSRKQPAGAIVPPSSPSSSSSSSPSSSISGPTNDTTTATTVTAVDSTENEHTSPTVVVEVAETGITADQVKGDVGIWGTKGVEIVVLVLVTWKKDAAPAAAAAAGRGGGEEEAVAEEEEGGVAGRERTWKREVEKVEVEVYRSPEDQEKMGEKMVVVQKTTLIGQPTEKTSSSTPTTAEKVKITRRQLLGRGRQWEDDADADRSAELDLGSLRALMQLAAPNGYVQINTGGVGATEEG